MLRYILLPLLLSQTLPRSEFAQQVIKALPTWEADSLAQYEQPELAVIRRDLNEGVGDEQLHADWDKLAGLDAVLQVEYLI